MHEFVCNDAIRMALIIFSTKKKKKEWHLSQNYIEIGILFVYYINDWASTLIYQYSIPFDRF